MPNIVNRASDVRPTTVRNMVRTSVPRARKKRAGATSGRALQFQTPSLGTPQGSILDSKNQIQNKGDFLANGDLNWIANFIWGIADDVLRDVYVRGKYRDVILPVTVIRRLDAILEPTKEAVL